MASFSGIKNTLLAEQVDEEAAPAHDPNQKQQGPGAICSRACCHFLWKKSCFPGRCGAYFLSTGSAVITMTRTVTSLPLSLSSILQSAVPM